MIFEELTLNQVSGLETPNPGDLSSVAAIYVETRFNLQDSGGINLPSLRVALKEKAVNIFSLYYANLGKPLTFFTDNTVDGVTVTSEGETITLEKVEFINLGEEECEDVVFKKVFFIPSNLLSLPANEDFFAPPTGMQTAAQLKICNYRDFKNKAKFIQTFMKINFLALQRPTNRSIVKGINFRKFSIKNKQINKFINFLDDVVPNKPNKLGESIIIHFAENFQTVSKIEYINEKVPTRRRRPLIPRAAGRRPGTEEDGEVSEILPIPRDDSSRPETEEGGEEAIDRRPEIVWQQSKEEFEVRKYKAFNDARVNFYLYNFESIYPDLFATTFRGTNIKFDNLVRRNFLVPNDLVTIVQNDCLASANSRQNASAADVTKRLRQSLSNVYAKEARSLLSNNPFKTAEDLIKESGFLESKDILATMGQTLSKEYIQVGHSIADEVSDFIDQLEKVDKLFGSDSSNLSKFGQFVNSIEWEQILAIAAASIASRYGIDEILDESFIKKQMAERISKFFKSPRVINDLMSKLPPARLGQAALIFAAADLANSLGVIDKVSIEEIRLRRLNRLLGERAELEDEERRITQGGTSEEIRTIPTLLEKLARLEAKIERTRERLNRSTNLAVLLEERDLEREEEEEDRDEEYIDDLEAAIAALEQETDSLDSQSAEEEQAFLDEAFGVPVGDPDATDPPVPQKPEQERQRQRERLNEIASGPSETLGAAETKNEIIDLIISLSNCDRQNNAKVYTEFIMFLVDELGGEILEYFNEWSEWLNAWDVKNLDFCNLPDLNLPKFKLFPLNIRLPDISMADIFGFILGAILAILYALLLRLIRALIDLLLSLIPDFIFDFEPCEFANALRDFGQVLGGAICAGINGVDPTNFAACSVLTPRTNNERNNRDLLNFFKDACGKGILPGAATARLLEGEADEETLQRADEYFQTVNQELATAVKENPSILTDTGSALGDVIGIGDMQDKLDDYAPRLPGLSANGFVDNLDLCSDTSVSDLIDQLCTEPNPALREELKRILEQQREAEKDDAAMIFRLLTDPESFGREIEDQLLNPHPSLIIPQMAADGLFNELPVIKNTPKFSLNRDQETLGEVHEDFIKATLGILDSCILDYGKKLKKRSNDHEDKIDKLNSPLRVAVKPKNNPVGITYPSTDEIIDKAFANNLFYLDEMPEGAREEVNRIIRENSEINESSKKSFDIGLNYYREQVFSPLSEEALSGEANEDSAFYGLVNPRAFDAIEGALNVSRIEEGLLVKQVLDKISFNEEVKFNHMARQMKKMGEDITEAYVRTRMADLIDDLDVDYEELIPELTGKDEEIPLAEEVDEETEEGGEEATDRRSRRRRLIPRADSSRPETPTEPRPRPETPLTLPGGNVSRLLSSSQLEAVMEDYLNGTFKQENTYKRFIKELPEYSQLLLVKTDNEIVSINENIKTIFKCIILEDAHLRFAVLNTSGNIFSTNNFSTAIYNRSSMAQKIEDEINTLFSDFEVNYNNNKIFGWNAISYYVYEIAKTTGQLSSLSRSLGRRATPQDLMYELIEEAVFSVNSSFVIDSPAENQLLYSVIEGTEPSSIVINFETPNLLEGREQFTQLYNFLERSVDPDGSEQGQQFLTSNMCFAVTRKAGALADSLGALTLTDITSEEQRSGTNSSSFSIDAFGAGKGALQTAVLESLKAGETVLLSYDDVFGTNADLSLMNKLLAYAEIDQDLNDFVFDNFDVKIKYRVFTSYAAKRLVSRERADELVRGSEVAEPTREELEAVRLGTASEIRSLGLHSDQKISTTFLVSGGEGATFIMTELCTFEKEVLSFRAIEENSLQELENRQFISKLMQTSNTSQLASEFKGSASVNIFLSCMLPFPNIINEATSYSVDRVIGEIADDGAGLVEVRDIIFKPVKIQNKICTKVSKDFLKNV